MSRISTGTGDDGTTGFVGGSRGRKTDPRTCAVGAIDETNDALGLAAALAARAELRETLAALQRDLFTLGADVAAPAGTKTLRIGDADVARVEKETDRLEAALPPLKNFILPGGTASAAALFVARGVARRAERETWALVESGAEVGAPALRYLNRLSDLLFLLARAENERAGASETKWPGTRG
ncbi:MAG: cob(I)yrinic acid a,c-diamide adenosyltransferase [Thermoplasmatota archaeon]